ncbi:noncompact myelin-associated protein [Kryptolebias marmoratus]|uniref:noncompact myelin-associated protein n=1 Tax=Kryptolebias marmoratus TaxID=37003 RepID=UPI0007F8CFD8|nr:noncompact myelin-associated protein [Kryptolebias marmoratus]
MTSSVPTVPNTTAAPNTTAVTKSQEQILIQSSGAMIALIVIGVIIILTVVLIILKTYNRRTHASRLLGGSSKPRAKLSQSTGQGSLPLNPLSSVSGSITNSNPASETRLELSSAEGNHIEQFSTTSDYSGSTVVTIHDTPLSGNT